MPRPRRRRRRIPAFAALVLGVAVVFGAACSDRGPSGSPDIAVDDVVMAVPAGANTAIYLVVENTGTGSDHLVEVRTDAGASSELHESRTGDDGLIRMHPLDRVEVPAGETVRFAPGGLHVMVFDAEPLGEGSTVAVDLEFARSGTITVDAEVRSPSELLG